MDKLQDIIEKSQTKRLEELRKDIEKYKENVNKCNIFYIDSLSYDIGANIDYLKYASKLSDERKKQVDSLESHYNSISDKVTQCQCVKKLKK